MATGTYGGATYASLGNLYHKKTQSILCVARYITQTRNLKKIFTRISKTERACEGTYGFSTMFIHSCNYYRTPKTTTKLYR